MILKKRELHLSYSQAFGVARTTDKFRPRYCAGEKPKNMFFLFLIFYFNCYTFSLSGGKGASPRLPFEGKSTKNN